MVSKTILAIDEEESSIEINTLVNEMDISLYLYCEGQVAQIHTEQKKVLLMVEYTGGVFDEYFLLMNENGVKIKLYPGVGVLRVRVLTHSIVGQSSEGVYAIVNYQ